MNTLRDIMKEIIEEANKIIEIEKEVEKDEDLMMRVLGEDDAFYWMLCGAKMIIENIRTTLHDSKVEYEEEHR